MGNRADKHTRALTLEKEKRVRGFSPLLPIKSVLFVSLFDVPAGEIHPAAILS